MSTSQNSRWGRSALISASSAIAILAFAPVINAQQASSQTAQQEVDIPAGPLADSLFSVSEIFGVAVIAPNRLVAGKSAPSVNGALNSQQTVNRLLSGTDLIATRNASGGYVISERNEEPAPQPISTSGDVSQPPIEPLIAETIIVTGQQIDRTLQDTKESVGVITAEDIETRSLIEIGEVLLQTANVSSDTGGTANISIRGVARQSFASGGTADLSTTFYDDVAITNNAIEFISQNLWDVQQVEVLRGPQSTNVGRNALIGALVIRSIEPRLDEFEGAFRVEAGNYETLTAEGMVNIPVTENSALRITAENSRTDGFIENTFTGENDFGGSESSTIRARYKFEPISRFRALASLQYVKGRNGEIAYVAAPGEPLDIFQTTSNLDAESTFEGTIGSLNLQWDLSDLWSIQSITAFSDGTFDLLADNDFSDIDGGEFLVASDQVNMSQELRAKYDDNTLRGVAGFYFLKDEVDSVNINSNSVPAIASGVPATLTPFYPPLFKIGISAASETESENFALFTQWEKDFVERITVSAGARLDYEKSSVFSESGIVLDASTPLPDPVTAGQQAEISQPGSGDGVQAGVSQVNAFLNSLLIPQQERVDSEFSAFLPELGLTFALSPSTNLSAFYKRGYRAGGSEIELSGELNEFDPEYLDNFEVSLRSQLLDNRLSLNANAYYGLWTDQQINVPIEGNQFNTRTENIGESTIWGLEVETRYAPTDRTELYASVGYASTEFDEFCSISTTTESLPDCEIGNTIGKDLAGNDFAISPNWTFSAGARHFVSENWYVQTNATFQDGSFGTIDNLERFETDGFFLFNASAGYKLEDFEIRAFVRNLFDEFYELGRLDDAFTGGLRILPGAPREYGIIVSKSF